MSEVEIRELMNSLSPVIAALMKRNMEICILRGVLGRVPTEDELCYYENELWLRNLNRWWQDRLTAPQKIHNFVWGDS